jgi:predicted O-linked N-acetylglucosamine transferase (SPINDLY family)
VNDDRRAIAPAMPSRQACGLPETGFVYCCFNQNFKIDRAAFGTWMRILAAVPGSVLWLFGSAEAAEARLRSAAARAGVDPARLVLAGWKAAPEHLARQRLADLFLDTLTYNAHTTASDSLWSGVPLLTLRGDDFAGRVASSLLHAVGLPELAVPDLPTYEATAIALASSSGRLGALRERLAANRTTMPLFRTRDFAAGLEQAYARM